MFSRIAAALFVVVAVSRAGPAAAADEAAFERSFFRTITLLYSTAPKETVASATQCVVSASKTLPDDIKQVVIEVDRRPVYRGDERVREIADALVPLGEAGIAPLQDCFNRLADGAFGLTSGAAPATSLPQPDDVEACPIYMDKVSGDEITCYCRPMLGGIAFGNKTYADISSICVAARHAGAMDFLDGGVVKAVFRAGCASYEGVEANGGLTDSNERTARSYYFPTIGEGDCPQ